MTSMRFAIKLLASIDATDCEEVNLSEIKEQIISVSDSEIFDICDNAKIEKG